MVRRWGFNDTFYPIVFGICCALANYDILLGGGALQLAEGGQYGVMLTRTRTKWRDPVLNARKRMQRRHRRAVREAQARADREETYDREEDEQRVIAALGHPEGEDYSKAED
jgi:hypothetical protein